MSRVALPDETQVERQLRPQRLEEYVGQRAAVESLRVSVEAARQRGEPLDHVLLSGPPGLGKTTLATIMANEMGASIVTTAGPSLERGADLMGILTNLAERDVLFIDEIHRLPRVVEELLYPAMEDFSINFVMDKGLNARTMRIPLRPFTLVGRDDAARHALLAAARALRDLPPPRLLLGGGARRDHPPLRVDPGDGASPRAGRRRSRGARAARRASPTGCCAGCATTRR